MKFLRDQKGISVLEIVVGMSVMAIGLLALAQLQINSLKGKQWSEKKTYATLFAQAYIEDAISTSFQNLPNLNNFSVTKKIGDTYFNVSIEVSASADPNPATRTVKTIITSGDEVFEVITMKSRAAEEGML